VQESRVSLNWELKTTQEMSQRSQLKTSQNPSSSSSSSGTLILLSLSNVLMKSVQSSLFLMFRLMMCANLDLKTKLCIVVFVTEPDPVPPQHLRVTL